MQFVFLVPKSPADGKLEMQIPDARYRQFVTAFQ